MKRNCLHRGMALLLAVCMMLTMNGGFAFAAEEPLPTEASTTETSGDAPTADSGKEYLADPVGSATEGETPSVDAPVCTCNPAPGTSSVEGHGKDCPLYEEPEPPQEEQGECTCPPVDSGEIVHGEDCPLYTAPEKPAAPQAPIDALAAVYALIDALPTLAELEAVDTEGADFPAYLEKLQADVATARAAYDALTPEEREAFDPARLQKLAEIEGLFGVSTMAARAVGDIFPAKVKLTNNGSDTQIDCYFKVLTSNTVEVSRKSSSAVAIDVSSVGALVIPGTVTGTDGVAYTVTGIGEDSFFSCAKLTDVTIPDGVTSIGVTAFSGCITLASITIPASVTSIGKSAFYRCRALTSITIPSNVTSIGDSTFYECRALTGITIPSSVTSIGNDAFFLCVKLTSITILNGVTSIGSNAFYGCYELGSINIPDSVTTLGDRAFYGCSKLQSVTISNSVASMGESVFNGCTSLTSITIPNSVISIGHTAFYGCTSLTSITIPNSVTSMGNSVFGNCTSLTSITIPNSVTSMGNSVFGNCTSLTSAKFECATAPTIGGYVFPNPLSGFKILIPHTNSGYLSGNTTNGWATYAPKIVTVTGVTVAPDAQMVIPGGTQQFTATVAGNNNPLQTVTWTISGQSSASTTISTDGLLTVAADETATTLTVTATSSTTEAPSKNASVTVKLGKATPGMTLAPSSASVTYGTPVTLTATVTGAGNTPTGTVVFKDGATTLATVNLSNGVATYSYNIPVTHGALTAVYSGDGGYKEATATSAAVTVTPKPLTVTAAPKTITYGDAKPTDFTATYSSFAYGETSSVLGGALAFTCSYNQFDDAKGYDITPGGLTSSNYAITFVKNTLTVNQKELALTWSGTTTREYDGTASNVTATATGMVNGDTVAVTVTNGNLSTVGTHTATASISAANYKLPTANTTTYTINPRTITMTLNDPTSFEYDSTEKTVTAKVTNIVGSEDVTVTLSGDKQTNKGDYTATAASLGGANAGNYRIATPAPTVAWKITGKVFPFEVIPPTASGITYGQPLSASTLIGNNSGASVRFSLFALIDSRGVDKTGTFAWKDGTQVLSSGTQTAVAVFTPTDTNYSPVDCNVTIEVAKKDVTVAVSGTKVYGAQPTPQSAFTVTPSGMLSGETALSLLGTLAFTSDGNTADAVVGSYAITVAQSGESNYKVTTSSVANGFTVTNATITGSTVTPYNGVYDGEEHPIVTVTGTQPGDTVTYSTDGISFSGTAPTVQAVTNDAPVYVKVSRANHDDFTSGKYNAQVQQREIAATFTLPANLVYDGNNKIVTAAITNKCGTDDVALTLDNATGKAVGKYTTTVSGLSGAAEVAGNYKLPSPAPSVAWAITGTPYPHEIVLPTTSGITYGQALSDSTLTGNNGGTGVFTWNDGAILPPSGSYTATVVFDPTDPNFAPVTREVQVAVAKKDVTIAVSGTKVYGAQPIEQNAFTVTPTGMVNGETDAALLGTLTLTSDGNKQAAIVGSYDISVAQSGESNYTVTTKTVTDGFTVTRATQTLSGTASYQKLLTDKDFALDIITDSTDTDAAVTYTLTNDGGGAVTLDADGKTVRMKKSGTATITANAAETANFAAAAPLTIIVTIGSNPAVRALATEDITTTGAKIGGVVTTGTIATTGYGLEYKKPSDADYTPVSANETATGDVKTLTHTLAGLEKDTEYAVRVWAKTADKNFESVTRFRTAAEQPPTGKVEGAITDNSGTNTAITVTIEAGNTVIASHTVKAGGGTFTFEALPDGFYNLVADNGKYRVTRMVEIVKGGAVTNVQMEIGRTQSVVEIVTPDTPNVAVDGLPELFGNDALFTQDNKDVITAGGTVEFKLTVEKKDTPADAEEIEKIAEGKVGVYLDIGLLKTVTDQNGREQESKLVPDLGANEITIVIPLPKELQGKESYTVYRVHDGTAEKLDSTHNADGNTLTIQSSLFSTYAITYTEKSGGTGGGSGGSSSDNDQYDFWMTVKEKIQNADDGDVVKVNAKGYDKMPWSVMDALRKNDDVSLVITWNGKTITIPAGKAQKNESGRIYWPLSLLAQLYSDIMEDTVLTPAPQNPETGGPGKYIPVTGGDLYEMTAPMAEQVTQPAAPDNAGATLPITPAVITPPDAGFEPDAFANTSDAEAVKTNSPILWVVIAGMLTAAAVACGVWFWKRKEREQA